MFHARVYSHVTSAALFSGESLLPKTLVQPPPLGDISSRTNVMYLVVQAIQSVQLASSWDSRITQHAAHLRSKPTISAIVLSLPLPSSGSRRETGWASLQLKGRGSAGAPGMRLSVRRPLSSVQVSPVAIVP